MKSYCDTIEGKLIEMLYKVTQSEVISDIWCYRCELYWKKIFDKNKILP